LAFGFPGFGFPGFGFPGVGFPGFGGGLHGSCASDASFIACVCFQAKNI
jgi:hypothetical protein